LLIPLATIYAHPANAVQSDTNVAFGFIFAVGDFAGAFPSTVWAVPNSDIETDAHPTSKPCKLFALPMQMHTQRGEICYEPFAGSGSQIVAAEQLGRRCFAIEKSPPFVAVALERMAAMGVKAQVMLE
jgi:DNA modification methylase